MPERRLIDLADARRSNKPWLPADDRDFTARRVLPDSAGKPCCRRHGAMNRVHRFEYIYRCSEFRCGVGARVVIDDAIQTK